MEAKQLFEIPKTQPKETRNSGTNSDIYGGKNNMVRGGGTQRDTFWK